MIWKKAKKDKGNREVSVTLFSLARRPLKRLLRIGLMPRWTAGSCFWILLVIKVDLEDEVEDEAGAVSEVTEVEADTEEDEVDSTTMVKMEKVIEVATEVEVVTEVATEAVIEVVTAEVTEEVTEAEDEEDSTKNPTTKSQATKNKL